MSSSTFNPLATIHTHNKLIGSNYVEWKRNLDIAIIIAGHKYVLTTFCPEVPGPDTPQEKKDQHNKWLKDDEMARRYILASMLSFLQRQHDSFKTASEIIYNLNEMFGNQRRLARQAAMKTVMSTKMAEGTPVQDHVLKMMDSLIELEVLGAEIDTESQINIILESLPNSFMSFKLNYNMNKMNLTMAELLSQLVVVEGIIKDQPSAHMKEKSFDRSKPKGKKISLPKGQRVHAGATGGVAKGKKDAGVKPKGKCFHYGMIGHWKRNCLDFLSKKKTTGVLGKQEA